VEFLYEALVAAELEGFDQVRFQVVLLPDPMNGVFARPWALAILGPSRCPRHPAHDAVRRHSLERANRLQVHNPMNAPAMIGTLTSSRLSAKSAMDVTKRT